MQRLESSQKGVAIELGLLRAQGNIMARWACDKHFEVEQMHEDGEGLLAKLNSVEAKMQSAATKLKGKLLQVTAHTAQDAADQV